MFRKKQSGFDTKRFEHEKVSITEKLLENKCENSNLAQKKLFSFAFVYKVYTFHKNLLLVDLFLKVNVIVIFYLQKIMELHGTMKF